MTDQKGFLLIEVLIVILVLAVAFTAFMGVMAQALRVSSRSMSLTAAISRFETVLFEIESGLRPDLVSYGGRGDLNEKGSYEIKPEAGGEFQSSMKIRLLWKSGAESMDFDLSALKAPAK